MAYATATLMNSSLKKIEGPTCWRSVDFLFKREFEETVARLSAVSMRLPDDSRALRAFV